MHPDRIRFSPPDLHQRHLWDSETQMNQVQIESRNRCAQDTTRRNACISVTRRLARTPRVLVAAPIRLQIWTLHAMAHALTRSTHTMHQHSTHSSATNSVTSPHSTKSYAVPSCCSTLSIASSNSPSSKDATQRVSRSLGEVTKTAV